MPLENFGVRKGIITDLAFELFGAIMEAPVAFADTEVVLIYNNFATVWAFVFWRFPSATHLHCRANVHCRVSCWPVNSVRSGLQIVFRSLVA